MRWLMALVVLGVACTPRAPENVAGMTPAPRAPTSAPTPAPRGLAPRSQALQILASMSLEQKVGQVFMLGFEGTRLTPENTALVHDLHLGGVTLFARNIDNAQQVARLDADLQSLADPVPLFISVDQEGGLVVRVTRGATIFPGNMAAGATGDPDVARRLAAAEAEELLAMGVNMNLAPVVDVNTNPLNPVIGVRAFGSEPGLVSRMGAAAVEGLQGGGVSAVAKHFPGHGDTSVDSHLDLPVVPHPLERLEAVEFQPFRAAIQAGVDGIMTAHVYVPSLEPEARRAATLSSAVLSGTLRERLGYTGLVLTDALDMGAIKERDHSAAEAAVEAFEAGADLLLVAGITAEDRAHLGEGPPALLAAVQSGRISAERLDASVLRVLQAKERRGLLSGQAKPPPPLVRHDELALEVARRAITLQRDDSQVLPLRAEQQNVLVVVPRAPTRRLVQDDQLPSSLLAAVQRFAPSAVAGGPADASLADVIVLGTYDLAQDPAQQALAQALLATGKPVVAVSLRGPYDAPFLPTVLAAYGDRPVHLQAAAEALFGQLAPRGRVP